jgi:hypothetical protein
MKAIILILKDEISLISVGDIVSNNEKFISVANNYIAEVAQPLGFFKVKIIISIEQSIVHFDLSEQALLDVKGLNLNSSYIADITVENQTIKTIEIKVEVLQIIKQSIQSIQSTFGSYFETIPIIEQLNLLL